MYCDEYWKPKVVAIIQARLTSTRLPRKVLMDIHGKTMLERVISSVRQAKLVNQVVVAAPHEIECSVPLYIGDENDVLKRYFDCASEFGADTIVRITSDCPLIDPTIIDYAIHYRNKTELPYVIFAPVDGLDTEVFTYKLLKEAHEKATELAEREHVTPYMRRKTKMSVDSLENLEKVRKIWNGEIKLSCL